MKKKIFGLFLALLLVITPVYAEEIKEEDANFLADESLVVETNIGGSLFAAGSNVKVKSKVDGLAFVAGQNVTVTNDSDYLFAAGQNIDVEGVTTKDAYLAGATITVTDSTLRDVFIAAGKITLSKNSVRNARISGEEVVIKGEITGDLNVAAAKVILEEGTSISGKLIINESAKLEKEDTVEIGLVEKYKDNTEDIKINPLKVILIKIIGDVISYLSILVLAFIMLALFKKFFANIKKLQEKTVGLKSIGIGFLTLCAVPVLSVLAMITVIGIPLGVVLLMLYVLAIFISAIPSTYYIGNILFKDKIKNDYLLITVSLLIFYLLKWIPIMGGLLELASLLLGLGLMIYLIKGVMKNSK